MERSSIVPYDLLEEILPRLPVRHLLRFRCVSKLWCSLIDDYNFIKKQHQYQVSVCKADRDVPLFLDKTGTFRDEQAKVFLLSKQQGDDVVLDLTPNLDRDSASLFTNDRNHYNYCDLSCKGLVKGVVLLERGNTHLGLWNPATREFKAVPDWPVLQEDKCIARTAAVIGFGFDPVSNDFKIVGYVDRGSVLQPPRPKYNYAKWHVWRTSLPIFRYEMYSLQTNSWTILRDAAGFDIYRGIYPSVVTDGYLNGVYYWAAKKYDGSQPKYPDDGFVVLSFNFSTNAFKVFDLPQDALSILAGGDFDLSIRLYMDSLACIVSCKGSEDPSSEWSYDICCFDIWVMTNFDDSCEVSVSWQHLFTINMRTIPRFEHVLIVAFRMDGDLLLYTVVDNYQRFEENDLYNPSMRTFKKMVDFGQAFRYVESLFPLSSGLLRLKW